MYRRSLTAALILIVVIGQLLYAQEPEVWGGDHIQLTSTATGGDVEFDCAVGKLDGPIRPDAAGHFEVRGTFTPLHHGPVRRNEADLTTPATYSGVVVGNAMTLTVSREGEKQPPPQYYLKHGPGLLRKCR